jgi:diaminopimelate dehydrogenase
MKKIKVAVVGYGNVGRYAVEAVEVADDMELVGIVRREVKEIPLELTGKKVVDNIDKLGTVDVAVLCGPTRSIEKTASELLAKGINTVDSFDIHSDIYALKVKLSEIAKKHGSKAIISAGWDPGSDSVVRAMMKAMVPFGTTFTNFGPGMSMGHSVVAKSKKGVADALSITMPLGAGIHRRIVYVQLESGADFEQACKEIKADSYFINDETKFIKTDDIKKVIDVGHGTNIVRKGVSGKTHNQIMSFDMKINNPALTSQIMVSCARATMKMTAGAYTMIEVPLINMLSGSEEDLIKELV